MAKFAIAVGLFVTLLVWMSIDSVAKNVETRSNCPAAQSPFFDGQAWGGTDVKMSFFGAENNGEEFRPNLSLSPPFGRAASMDWKRDITASIFWVGESAVSGGGVANKSSAWDADWVGSFGGVDTPAARRGYCPAGFVPKENPFYVALPYCDLAKGELKPSAAKAPWLRETFLRPAKQSICKGRWIEVRHGLKTCYAQWEDAGPFQSDDAEYVFGQERPKPNVNHDAGIDVSPAVRDYLGLSSLDRVDWRFVSKPEVGFGPWLADWGCGRSATSTAFNEFAEEPKKALVKAFR
jgi:hypothetical protein